MVNRKIVQAAEAYFTELCLVRASSGATDEHFLYVPLANLLDAVGGTLEPEVSACRSWPTSASGHSDFGLYLTRQVQKGLPKTGQEPEAQTVRQLKELP